MKITSILANIRTKGQALISQVKERVGVKGNIKQINFGQLGQGKILNNLRGTFIEVKNRNRGFSKRAITPTEKKLDFTGEGRPPKAVINAIPLVT